MVIILMIRSETDVQGSDSLSITGFVKPFEDQRNLLDIEQEEDELIGRFKARLAEYEQELYKKDVCVKKLENKLRQTWNTSNYREKVLW